MTTKRKWESIDTDYEFAAMFTNATIRRATSSFDGEPPMAADLYWELSDGTWLAMSVNVNPGCDTCSYGGSDKDYWVLRP